MAKRKKMKILHGLTLIREFNWVHSKRTFGGYGGKFKPNWTSSEAALKEGVEWVVHKIPVVES